MQICRQRCTGPGLSHTSRSRVTTLLHTLGLRQALLCARQASVADLQAALYKAKPKLYPARQRFTLPKKEGEKKPIALANGKRLSDYDLADGAQLTFKDLGPQVRRPYPTLPRRPAGLP